MKVKTKRIIELTNEEVFSIMKQHFGARDIHGLDEIVRWNDGCLTLGQKLTFNEIHDLEVE